LNLTVSQMSFEEIAPIVPIVRKGHMRVRNTERTIWFGAKIDDELVGIVSCVLYEEYIFYNTDFVKKEFRNQGIYRKLFEERDKYASTLKTKKIKAKCTPYSIRYYLKNGFTVTGMRKSITFVEKLVGEDIP